MTTVSQQFRRRVNSDKLECTTCGRTGYPWPEFPGGPPSYARWWANGCLRGHAPCPHCGKQLGVTKHGKPRTHGRCPRRSA